MTFQEKMSLFVVLLVILMALFALPQIINILFLQFKHLRKFKENSKKWREEKEVFLKNRETFKKDLVKRFYSYSEPSDELKDLFNRTSVLFNYSLSKRTPLTYYKFDTEAYIFEISTSRLKELEDSLTD